MITIDTIGGLLLHHTYGGSCQKEVGNLPELPILEKPIAPIVGLNIPEKDGLFGMVNITENQLVDCLCHWIWCGWQNFTHIQSVLSPGMKTKDAHNSMLVHCYLAQVRPQVRPHPMSCSEHIIGNNEHGVNAIDRFPSASVDGIIFLKSWTNPYDIGTSYSHQGDGASPTTFNKLALP